MHLEKYKSNAIGQLLAHVQRREGRSFGNESIDKSKTHLNYNLIERGSTYIHDRINEVNHVKRADAVLLVGAVVTKPKDYKGDEKAFFKAVTNAFAERYGAENIAYATVHKDEVCPHLHLGIIPIVTADDGSEKLCAKELFNRQELRRLHPEIEKAVNKRLKEPVHLLNGRTLKNPKTGRPYRNANDLKRERLKEERELPQKLFGGIDYKEAYAQERAKVIEQKAEIVKLYHERYAHAARADSAERALVAENEERCKLIDMLNDPHQLRARLKELERAERGFVREKEDRER